MWILWLPCHSRAMSTVVVGEVIIKRFISSKGLPFLCSRVDFRFSCVTSLTGKSQWTLYMSVVTSWGVRLLDHYLFLTSWVLIYRLKPNSPRFSRKHDISMVDKCKGNFSAACGFPFFVRCFGKSGPFFILFYFITSFWSNETHLKILP